MKTLFKIAWRSLWRNRRRTVLTAASVFIAIVLALFMRSMQLGSYAQMISAGINQTGHLQIHKKGYHENQTVEHSFFCPEGFIAKIENVKGVTAALPKAETFSLVSYGSKTKGMLVTGIVPGKEDARLNISKKIIKGEYLGKHDGGILLGDDAAKYLNANVGDSIVLIGQGYRGITSYGLFPVKGIFHLPSPRINTQVVFMNIEQAQEFIYPYRKGITTTVQVFIDNNEKLPVIKDYLKRMLGKGFEVISWKSVLSDMLQSIKIDNVSGQAMLYILYIIAAFGIFSTVLMNTMEKRKQYAVMISIGMKRSKLVIVSVFETLVIIVIGIIAGLAVIFPVLFYLHYNPIPLSGEVAKMFLEFNIEPVIPFSIKPQLFVKQTAIVTLLSFVSVLYPVLFLYKFNVLKAFRR
jgi:ABC-type lipoprotein release transport system permease subunit